MIINFFQLTLILLDNYFFAVNFHWVEGNEACVGSKLVHNWWAPGGSFLCKADHTLHAEDSLGKRCDSKELVSQSNIPITP